jgi:hypothetical protein
VKFWNKLPQGARDRILQANNWAFRKADTVRTSLAVSHAGLDSALVDPRSDLLNRHRIAREVYRIIKDNTNDQSVRIGIFGDWGYGKTTIVNWVDHLARADGHIVVWFNPWSIKDVNALWLSFILALDQALAEHDIHLPNLTRWKTLLGDLKGSFSQSQASSGFLGDVAGALLRFGKEDAEKLLKQLAGRRLIVCIDDLDRADPTILPQLFLSLRELLDLKGLAFVMPFEKRIVSETLLSHHPAWGSGERFLEKILDFQIAIPTTTADERWDLFLHTTAGDIPAEAVAALSTYRELLPDNPRRIKRVARAFELLRQEVKRHGSKEIDWPSLLLGNLMQLESEEFFKRFVASTYENMNAWSAERMAGDAQSRIKARSQRVEKLLEESKISDVDQKRRLEVLAERWEQERFYYFAPRVRYALRLFDRPDAFTWQEIEELQNHWIDPASLVRVTDLIAAKQSQLSRSTKEIVDELLGELLKTYSQALENAASCLTVAEHATTIVDAQKCLQRLRHLVMSEDYVNAASRLQCFRQVLGLFRTWARFRTNAADIRLREAERTSRRPI